MRKHSELGDCYEKAAHLLVEELGPGAELVHGEVWGEGVGWHGHAWCEKDGVAYDRSNMHDIAWPTAVYYSLGHVRNTVRYSFDEACTNLIEKGHYGPWQN